MWTKVNIKTQVQWTTDDLTEWVINLFKTTSDKSKIDNLPADTNAVLNTKLESVVAWPNIVVDNTDPINPIISATWVWVWDVTASWTLTNNTIILGGWTKTVKSSSKTIVTTLWTDDTTVPTSKAVKDVTDTKVTWNTPITWATKTKITYDAKGLVTAWADATTADISDSTDRRYLSDTQKTEATRNANASQNWLLSSTDWNTFNNKQPAWNYATWWWTATWINTWDETETTLLSKLTLFNDSKDPTWFVDPSNISDNYDSTTRTVTLTHSSWSIEYYWRWKKYSLASPWISTAHTNSAWNYYLLSTDWTNFTWSTTPWAFSDLQVTYVQFWTYNIWIAETHGMMPWQAHQEFHETIWAYLSAWWDLSSYVLNSTTAANRRPDVATTTIKDEDHNTILSALTAKLYTQRYLVWAWATRTFTTWAADIVPLSGNQPYWNQNNAGTWQQTLFWVNDYWAIFLVAIPTTTDAWSQNFRYMWVQPQQVSWTLATIQALTPANLTHWDSSSLVSEFVFIWKIIIRYTWWNWQLISVEKLTWTTKSQIWIAQTWLTSVTTNATLTWDWTWANPLWVNVNLPVTTIELWAASDTTISRVSAWVIAVEWVTIPTETSTNTITNKTFDTTNRTQWKQINAQTWTTYTFVLTDAWKIVTFWNASATTVTVPPNSDVAFPNWTMIEWAQLGAWKVTFAPGSWVTIQSEWSNKSIYAQYVGYSLVKEDTNTWSLFWKLSA